MNLLDKLKSMSDFKVNLLLIFLSVLAGFWQCLFLPFIQDDWAWIEAFKQNDIFSLIGFIFDTHNFFYRPLAQLYFLLFYKVFGDNALPFHVIGLLIHILSSLVVVFIFSYLAKDRLIGLLSGLIYAVAVSIHLDTILWIVGIYDLGAALFFFLAIWFFIRSYQLLSISAFLISSLFKESVVILPFILIIIEIFYGNKNFYFKGFIFKIIPYLIISAFVVYLKTRSGESLITLPSNHPYALNLWSGKFITNVYLYVKWLAQALIPLGNDLPFFLIIILIFIVIIFWISQRWKKNYEQFLILSLVSWVLICLLPVLFLSNHTYRYYAVYALPAFICFGLVTCKSVLSSAGISNLRVKRIILSIGVFVIFISVVQSNKIFREGLSQTTFADGSNMLVQRAAYIGITKKFLLDNFPNFSDNTVLVFDGIEVWAFNKSSALRVWYNNKTLNVYEYRNLRYESGKWLIRNPAENQNMAFEGSNQKDILLDSENLYVFTLKEGKIYQMDIDKIASQLKN